MKTILDNLAFHVSLKWHIIFFVTDMFLENL